MNTLTDYFFWFAQPSTVLNSYDWGLAYLFAGMVVLAVIIWLVNRLFVRHEVVKRLLNKYVNALVWMGLLGIVWFGFRYEAVPLLSKRIMAGIVLLGAVVWLGFVKWYFLTKFFKDKRNHDYNLVKSKYMP